MCSPEIVLSQVTATATRSGARHWVSVIGNAPISSFRLPVDVSGEFVFIGFCPRTSFRTTDVPSSGYYICLGDGTTYSGVQKAIQFASLRRLSGDVVTARLTPAGDIHFGKNGCDWATRSQG
ncbi:Aste57867_625 [Aphanomyces stellatus]|uniref:Aste57867_625 protein n=1 Tax=Aphanomyces stellatus TaxID=120398 RepID=A0A485K3F6_9STRA|nr:hypothetical protein As57867_000624 [Aphanomyces stellatus]VFT77850.1 Aste57867_625 [Aphanomyces stellatus]